MKTRIFCFIFVFALIFSMPYVFAIDTQISVKTLGFHKVSVFVLDDSQQLYTLLESFHKKTDVYGVASITYSGSKESVKLRFQITDEQGQLIKLTNDKPFYEIATVKTGSPLYFQMIPGNISENYMAVEAGSGNTEINDSINDSEGTAVIETIGGSDSSATGNSIFGNLTLPSWNSVLIAVGAILALAIVVFASVKISRHVRRSKGQYFSSSNSNLQGLETSAIENELYTAKQKLQEAQSEINRIKNRDRIAALQKKLDDDRKELDRLKRGL